MPSPHHPTQNHLLAALPKAEYDRLVIHLELVPMSLGEGLYDSGGIQQYVYFPTTSIVSLLDFPRFSRQTIMSEITKRKLNERCQIYRRV